MISDESAVGSLKRSKSESYQSPLLMQNPPSSPRQFCPVLKFPRFDSPLYVRKPKTKKINENDEESVFFNQSQEQIDLDVQHHSISTPVVSAKISSGGGVKKEQQLEGFALDDSFDSVSSLGKMQPSKKKIKTRNVFSRTEDSGESEKGVRKRIQFSRTTSDPTLTPLSIPPPLDDFHSTDWTSGRLADKEQANKSYKQSSWEEAVGKPQSAMPEEKRQYGEAASENVDHFADKVQINAMPPWCDRTSSEKKNVDKDVSSFWNKHTVDKDDQINARIHSPVKPCDVVGDIRNGDGLLRTTSGITNTMESIVSLHQQRTQLSAENRLHPSLHSSSMSNASSSITSNHSKMKMSCAIQKAQSQLLVLHELVKDLKQQSQAKELEVMKLTKQNKLKSSEMDHLKECVNELNVDKINLQAKVETLFEELEKKNAYVQHLLKKAGYYLQNTNDPRMDSILSQMSIFLKQNGSQNSNQTNMVLLEKIETLQGDVNRVNFNLKQQGNINVNNACEQPLSLNHEGANNFVKRRNSANISPSKHANLVYGNNIWGSKIGVKIVKVEEWLTRLVDKKKIIRNANSRVFVRWFMVVVAILLFLFVLYGACGSSSNKVTEDRKLVDMHERNIQMYQQNDHLLMEIKKLQSSNEVMMQTIAKMKQQNGHSKDKDKFLSQENLDRIIQITMEKQLRQQEKISTLHEMKQKSYDKEKRDDPHVHIGPSDIAKDTKEAGVEITKILPLARDGETNNIKQMEKISIFQPIKRKGREIPPNYVKEKRVDTHINNKTNDFAKDTKEAGVKITKSLSLIKEREMNNISSLIVAGENKGDAKETSDEDHGIKIENEFKTEEEVVVKSTFKKKEEIVVDKEEITKRDAVENDKMKIGIDRIENLEKSTTSPLKVDRKILERKNIFIPKTLWNNRLNMKVKTTNPGNIFSVSRSTPIFSKGLKKLNTVVVDDVLSSKNKINSDVDTCSFNRSFSHATHKVSCHNLLLHFEPIKDDDSILNSRTIILKNHFVIVDEPSTACIILLLLIPFAVWMTLNSLWIYKQLNITNGGTLLISSEQKSSIVLKEEAMAVDETTASKKISEVYQDEEKCRNTKENDAIEDEEIKKKLEASEDITPINYRKFILCNALFAVVICCTYGKFLISKTREIEIVVENKMCMKNMKNESLHYQHLLQTSFKSFVSCWQKEKFRRSKQPVLQIISDNPRRPVIEIQMKIKEPTMPICLFNSTLVRKSVKIPELLFIYPMCAFNGSLKDVNERFHTNSLVNNNMKETPAGLLEGLCLLNESSFSLSKSCPNSFAFDKLKSSFNGTTHQERPLLLGDRDVIDEIFDDSFKENICIFNRTLIEKTVGKKVVRDEILDNPVSTEKFCVFNRTLPVVINDPEKPALTNRRFSFKNQPSLNAIKKRDASLAISKSHFIEGRIFFERPLSPIRKVVSDETFVFKKFQCIFNRSIPSLVGITTPPLKGEHFAERKKSSEQCFFNRTLPSLLKKIISANSALEQCFFNSTLPSILRKTSTSFSVKKYMVEKVAFKLCPFNRTIPNISKDNKSSTLIKNRKKYIPAHCLFNESCRRAVIQGKAQCFLNHSLLAAKKDEVLMTGNGDLAEKPDFLSTETILENNNKSTSLTCLLPKAVQKDQVKKSVSSSVWHEYSERSSFINQAVVEQGGEERKTTAAKDNEEKIKPSYSMVLENLAQATHNLIAIFYRSKIFEDKLSFLILELFQKYCACMAVLFGIMLFAQWILSCILNCFPLGEIARVEDRKIVLEEDSSTTGAVVLIRQHLNSFHEESTPRKLSSPEEEEPVFEPKEEGETLPKKDTNNIMEEKENRVKIKSNGSKDYHIFPNYYAVDHCENNCDNEVVVSEESEVGRKRSLSSEVFHEKLDEIMKKIEDEKNKSTSSVISSSSFSSMSSTKIQVRMESLIFDDQQNDEDEDDLYDFNKRIVNNDFLRNGSHFSSEFSMIDERTVVLVSDNEDVETKQEKISKGKELTKPKNNLKKHSKKETPKANLNKSSLAACIRKEELKSTKKKLKSKHDFITYLREHACEDFLRKNKLDDKLISNVKHRHRLTDLRHIYNQFCIAEQKSK